MADGKFEISLSNPALAGGISAEVYESPESQISNYIIRTDQKAEVRIHWYIKGTLVPFICGKWCVTVYFESMGSPKGPDYNEDEFDSHSVELDLDPCKALDKEGRAYYWATIPIPMDKIDTKKCGRPYKLVAAVTYKTVCHKPGPMAGFVEGPLVQFYEAQ